MQIHPIYPYLVIIALYVLSMIHPLLIHFNSTLRIICRYEELLAPVITQLNDYYDQKCENVEQLAPFVALFETGLVNYLN